MIAKLKEGGSDDSNAACHSAELEALQEEKSLLQEVFRQTKQELDHLRAENEVSRYSFHPCWVLSVEPWMF